MKARVIDGADLLQQQGYEVLAPFCDRGRDTYFDTVTPENRERIQLHGANPYYPPKRFVLPQIERLLTVRTRDGRPRIEPIYEEPRRALFGIRSCDVAGIQHLDRFYLGREFRDIYYEKRRRNLVLVNVVCADPEREIGDECFCVCADTGPAARDHFDLQLMDLGGEYMAVAGSAAGEALFASPMFKQGGPSHAERRRALLAEARKRFKTHTSWFAAAVRYVSQDRILDATWEEIGKRCLECGGCTYVCPACTCFTVSDRETGPNEIERVRIWDSCALGGFTRMAGGFNPRRAVHDRRNRRFFRKLAHYFIQRELSMACVGCGRCVAVCHGDVGMPTVVEMIRRATAATDQPAPAQTA
jgi:sulfhydrogenase subunit beta (sulfur reductase)